MNINLIDVCASPLLNILFVKVLDQSDLLKGKRGSGDGSQGPPKVKRQRIKDENGNGTYLNRKTTSLGALGQALHGK